MDVDYRIVQLLENISGFVSLLRKGRLELPVFKLDRRLTLFNQGEDDLPDFIWARHVQAAEGRADS